MNRGLQVAFFTSEHWENGGFVRAGAGRTVVLPIMEYAQGGAETMRKTYRVRATFPQMRAHQSEHIEYAEAGNIALGIFRAMKKILAKPEFRRKRLQTVSVMAVHAPAGKETTAAYLGESS